MNPTRRLAPLPLSDVTVNGPFWGPRLESNRRHTLPAISEEIQRIGMYNALDLDQPLAPLPFPRGKDGVTPVMFWDSDLAKWIEAAAYSLHTHPDADLEAQVDALIGKLVALQQPDGYLNSFFIRRDPQAKFTNERDWHEMYCAGHLLEAAVAYFEATGKRDLLNALIRYVDLLASVYGPGPSQRRGYPGHEELELAVVKLWRATGEPRFLAFARYLIEERGRQPVYFDAEARTREADPGEFSQRTYEYMQAHKPVREHEGVVGHAVRAMYLYAAVTDLATETHDADLLGVSERLFTSLVDKRLYLTGGLGPSASNEGMTRDFDLPNLQAYAETCASIGLVFWAQRLGEARPSRVWGDAMERAIYNNVLSGVSLDGRRFFYDNPLESRGGHERFAWHPCPCCPPNLARLLASLGRYVYSASGDELAVHLYAAGSARVTLGSQSVTLSQETAYPWDGNVTLSLGMASEARFTLLLRLPGWCRNPSLAVNGEPQDLQSIVQDGYAAVTREWRDGDQVRLNLPMPIERVYASPRVADDAGLVALQRGPLVYCLEGADNEGELHSVAIEESATFEATFEPGTLGGVCVLHGPAWLDDSAAWGEPLYAFAPPRRKQVTLRAVPYSTWANRGAGPMRVWLRQTSGEGR